MIGYGWHMEMDGHSQTPCITGGGPTTPAPDNDNWRLKPDWMTPAEFLQWLRREKERMQRELEADFRLRSCPKHRQDWDILVAIERCASHRYGIS